ncbi:DExH-box ATP-dependent RNA helicase DExH17 [Telopea speciosissima]|uniref:DExH-box ATP-dependent RNA helicase DExH17 n=1 Tax=Telopea speciosissima TaxID=54955 RepID=UPI001CC57184|nr:DExH-box ATP-dependent RNA helicase DExH17 [Telopea speciosissima]
MSSTMDSYALKSVSDLPAPFRSTFSFRYFNSLQSECFASCFLSNVNMVISAPTGSGKTVLFELCILRLLSRFLSQEGKFIHIKGTLKTVYIAPSKALVQEKLRDWDRKLGSWGINCLELTGDNESYNIRNIQEADIILTTPEKFDAVTRYHIRDGGLSFFSDIALVLIDEVHLLNDPRGAALEAIVSRIKMLSRNPEMKSSPLSNVRFLAVSATIPNIEDLAEWLMVPVEGIKSFGEEMRPVKLMTKVFGYAPAKNDFLFERRLQNFIFDILMQHSRGKSALIFCSTRKGAQEAAVRLSQTAMSFGHSNPFIKYTEQQEKLKEASLSCSDKQMQSCILYGVGYHNGGLCQKDRNLIEGLFLKSDLQILCTTNTLAHGINLPAHTVIIKSTQYFNKEKGLYMEYDRSMVLQMSGRAGRPPFDDTGLVIIMTRRETVHLYENLLSGCEMVESQLLSCITEHLTAEIVQLTVSDITRAIEWMKCSYLYLRMKKNPKNYAVKNGIPTERLEKHMHEICVQKVNELSRYGMIWTDEYGFLLKPLEPGKLMTKYYLKFDTMKHIIQSPENCSLEDALHIICRSEELAWMQLRRNEKKFLNDINADKDGRLRFHILGGNGKRKKRIQTREEKIFVLASDCLTGDPSVHDLSLNQDMNSICSNGCRIAKCMKEYFAYKKNYKGTMNSTLLAKCLHQRLWDDSIYLLKQLPGIGMVTAKALNAAGINSFATLSEADPRRIEIVTGRKFPFGNHIKETLSSLPPKVEMRVEEIECRSQGKSKLVITLTRLSQSVPLLKRHYADMVVGLETDNLILFQEKISRVDEFSSPYSTTILVPNPQRGTLTVKADLMFEEYIGLDLHETLLVTRKNVLNTIPSGSKQPIPAYSVPKEIYVVEEDDEKSTSQVLIEELPILRESKWENVSMPSFNLLQDDMDEGVFTETEEPECEILTEKTIFDHIRRKAKNFPVLATTKTIDSSSSSPELLILTRKRTREKQLQLYGATEVLTVETDTTEIPRDIVVIPDQDSRTIRQFSYGSGEGAAMKNQIVSKSSSSSNVVVEQMPAGAMEPEVFIPAGKRFWENQPHFQRFITVLEEADPDRNQSETVILPYSEPRESGEKKTSAQVLANLSEPGNLDHSWEVSSATTMAMSPSDVFSMKKVRMGEEGSPAMPSRSTGDISNEQQLASNESYRQLSRPDHSWEVLSPTTMVVSPSNVFSVKKLRTGEKGSPVMPLRSTGDSSNEQQLASNGSYGQSCSLKTIGGNREVASFLRFESVFSFL